MTRLVRASFLMSGLLAATGCTSTLVRAAGGESTEVFRAILGATPGREISPREATRIAIARAGVELREAKGEAGVAVVRALAPCASALAGPLRERAKLRDEVGALAAESLLDAGVADPMEYAANAASEDPAWRAVGARAMTLGDDGAAPPPCELGWNECSRSGASRAGRAANVRNAALLDGHANVRRAALRAAADAADPRDVPALLDASRRDPDAEARSLAIAALGKTASVEAVLGLADSWPHATEDERVAIVHAWAASLKREGRALCGAGVETVGCVAFRELWRGVEAAVGKPSLVAALELVASTAGETPAHPLFVSAVGIAFNAIERAIDEGPPALRVVAIERAPLNHAVLLEAVVAAGLSEDSAVAVAALARLAADDTPVSPAERKAARESLRERAGRDDACAPLAVEALVRMRDASVKPRVFRDASSKDAEDRRAAAAGLARIGATSEALALTTDADATVRAHAICSVLRSGAR